MINKEAILYIVLVLISIVAVACTSVVNNASEEPFGKVLGTVQGNNLTRVSVSLTTDCYILSNNMTSDVAISCVKD